MSTSAIHRGGRWQYYAGQIILKISRNGASLGTCLRMFSIATEYLVSKHTILQVPHRLFHPHLTSEHRALDYLQQRLGIIWCFDVCCDHGGPLNLWAERVFQRFASVVDSSGHAAIWTRRSYSCTGARTFTPS